MALLSPVLARLGVPIITLDFSQLGKIMPALAFNFMIAATNVRRDKWNMHAVTPSDNFFTHVPFFVHCPMRKFWRTSLRPFGQNNVGKPAIIFPLLMGRTEGKNGSFMAITCIRMRIHQNFSSPMTLS